MRDIELLAPARDAATALTALDYGADAVYIGAPSHGARAAATNSIEDIRRVVNYAHRYQAKVYVTVNTIIYDDELEGVESMIWDLYRIGVDALIVQDLGILRMNLPPIALHASTQCDTRDAAKARFLQDAGFSQIVLARELSLPEIRDISDSVNVPLEVFVHGALCASYSGDCHASWALKRRSANRGECAQICRLPWRLIDASGREVPVARGRHLLSLRDMNRSRHVAEMLEAGVSSFKIEGRLKDQAYVKNVVSAYRRIIDDAIKANPDKYRRSSLGETTTDLIPDLDKSFNRGYTDYFLNQPAEKIASIASPKSIGTEVGIVLTTSPKYITARLSAPLSNGDGLGFFNADGEFVGFRLNKIEGSRLFPASPVSIPSGTRMYRNSDKAWNDQLERSRARRLIPARIMLRRRPVVDSDRVLVAASMRCADIEVTMSREFDLMAANRPQSEQRRAIMGKLGDSVYSLVELDDRLDDLFIPASALTALRRDVAALMDRAVVLRHQFEYRRPENREAPLPQGDMITYHDNVANELAREFYHDHGAKKIETALECGNRGAATGELRVMTTRYCLRRELGACLKTGRADALPRELFLVNGSSRLRVECDCARCQMMLYKT